MQTETSIKLAVRPFTADDYADITRLHNANFPEFSMSPDEFQFDDSQRVEPCRLERWVAECDGRIVGFAHYEQMPQTYHPRKFQLNITVDPEFYGRGIGRQLYDLVLGEVQQFDPIAVDEWTRSDMTWRVGFLERRGFVEDMRMWTSELDLTEFDPGQYAAEVAAVEAQGIQLRTWADLGSEDQSVHQRSYEAWLAIRADIPIPPNDQRTETSFDVWWTRTSRPDLLPEGYFVAVAGGGRAADRYDRRAARVAPAWYRPGAESSLARVCQSPGLPVCCHRERNQQSRHDRHQRSPRLRQTSGICALFEDVRDLAANVYSRVYAAGRADAS